MRHVEMKIESYLLDDIGRSATIEYWKDDFALMVRASIYDNNEMDAYNFNFPILREEFDTMDDAIKFLETECERLIVEEFKRRAWQGRRAQERLDEINANGFKL